MIFQYFCKIFIPRSEGPPLIYFDLYTLRYPFTPQSRLLIPLEKKAFENIVGNVENACNQHFPFSHIVFCPFQHKFKIFSQNYFVVCKCFEFRPV